MAAVVVLNLTFLDGELIGIGLRPYVSVYESTKVWESGSQAIRRSQRHAALMLSHPHSLPLPLPLPLSLSLSLLNTLLEMRRIG